MLPGQQEEAYYYSKEILLLIIGVFSFFTGVNSYLRKRLRAKQVKEAEDNRVKIA